MASWRLVQLQDVNILSLNTLLDVLALIIALVAFSAERNVSAPLLRRHGRFWEEAELLLLKKHSVLVFGNLFLVAVKVASVDFRGIGIHCLGRHCALTVSIFSYEAKVTSSWLDIRVTIL